MMSWWWMSVIRTNGTSARSTERLRIPKPDIQLAKNGIQAGRRLWEETILKDIPRDKTLYVHCRSGKRSADSIAFLSEIGYDLDRMYNVEGGILAWADEIDPEMPKY